MAVVGGHPQVTIREIDLSVRVPGFPGVYGAIVIPAKRGPIDEPQLVTSEAQLLRKFTPEEKIEIGYDLAYFSALAFLQKANKLWVKRAIGDNYLHSGAVLKEFTDGGDPNASLVTGEEDPTAYTFGADDAVLIHSADPGDWGDKYGFRLWLQRDREDIILGDPDGNIGYGPPVAATGTITAGGATVAIAATPGEAGNVAISFTDDISEAGTLAVTSIQILLPETGFVGGEYILISTPYEDFYVWTTKDAAGVDPAPAGATSLGSYDVITAVDTQATIADGLAALIDANAGFSCPSTGTGTVLVTAVRTGVALSAPDGSGMPTQATVSETVPGVASGVTATYDAVGATIDVTLEDLQTSALDIKNAMEALAIIDTFDLDTLLDSDGWDVSWLGVTLSGGTSGPNTITVTQFFASGEPVRFSKSASGSDVLPAGMLENVTYYIIEDTLTTIKLAPTQADALAGTSEIDLTDSGTGTMVLVPLVDVRESGAIQIDVYHEDNENEPIESWTVSRTPGQKNGLGNNMYIEDMLEGSNYIRAVDNALITGEVRPQVTVLYLGGGDDGDAVTDGKMMLAADGYNDTAGFPITCLMDGGWATPAYQLHLDGIAQNRHDCVALLSVPYDKEASANYINEIVDYRKTILNLASSFSAMYTPHVKIYDKYNDRYLYVSPDGYAGAAISFTAYNYEMWYPVGGFKRGALSVLDTRRRFTKGELDFLYENDLNPNRFYPGRGINIWGQKTLYGQPSALDRLNVRLLLVVIEPAIAAALESFLFDLNDATTRKLAKAMIDDYMEGVKGRRGVYEFYTQCDEDNNTDNDIDNHILNVHLFIKPTLSVEYIPFTVVIMRTGLSLQLAQEAV